MKAKELIAELQKVNPEAELSVSAIEEGTEDEKVCLVEDEVILETEDGVEIARL